MAGLRINYAKFVSPQLIESFDKTLVYVSMVWHSLALQDKLLLYI